MKITRAVALIGAALVLAGCASVDTNSDEAAVVYNSGGFGEDTTFKQCQGSNLNDYYDPGSVGYIYPKGQRTYEFDSVKREHGNAESGDLTFVTKDGVTMSARGLLNFALNTDCEVMRKFHEQIGLKYGAGEADGGGIRDWTALLNNYLGIPLLDTVKTAGRQFDWRQLYDDTDGARQKFVDAIIQTLPNEIEELAEGAYFDPDRFTLKIPDILPPKALLDQIQEQKTQAERITTIDAQAAALAQEQAQIEALVRILGPEGYIMYRNMLRCEDDNPDTTCVPFIPVPQGSNITVNPGG